MINNLPPELLVEIFINLPHKLNVTNNKLVCKYWNEILSKHNNYIVLNNKVDQNENNKIKDNNIENKNQLEIDIIYIEEDRALNRHKFLYIGIIIFLGTLTSIELGSLIYFIYYQYQLYIVLISIGFLISSICLLSYFYKFINLNL